MTRLCSGSQPASNDHKVVIKPSPLHGKGLFSKTRIRTGEIAVRWVTTKEISSQEYATLPETEKKIHCYSGWKNSACGQTRTICQSLL